MKSPSQKVTCCVIPFVGHSGKDKTMVTEDRHQWSPEVKGGGRTIDKEHKGILGVVELFCAVIVLLVTRFYMWLKLVE